MTVDGLRPHLRRRHAVLDPHNTRAPQGIHTADVAINLMIGATAPGGVPHRAPNAVDLDYWNLHASRTDPEHLIPAPHSLGPAPGPHRKACMVTPQPEGLVSVLLNPAARIDERDDAAMDLADYPGELTLNALVIAASSPTEDDLVVESAAESLGQLLAGQSEWPTSLLTRLRPDARQVVERVLRAG